MTGVFTLGAAATLWRSGTRSGRHS
jgi:hypothetical protein